jgi:RNA polymerase sigma factor (sigma-70 family)
VTDSEPSDAELLARHVGGDPHAFGVLVQRHRDRLWAVAIRTLGDREEAADALQDAFVSAFRRADSFRGDAQFTTWMHRIVVNACLDRIRRRKTRPTEPLPDNEDRMEELGEQPDRDPATTVEERSAVLHALRTLPEPQRSAIVLVDMEGYPVEEAARILGCAVGTIKSRCARGRAKLLPLLRHLRGADPAAQQAGGPGTPSATAVRDEQGRGGGDG